MSCYGAACLLLALTQSSPPKPPAQDAETKALVEKIAKSEDLEGEEAAEKLLDRLISPISDAVGSVESRPLEQQLRLRRFLGRLSANLRFRLVRADLTPEDRKLLDEFARFNPQLVDQLFDDDPRRRKAALGQIPLEPGTGAGVLVVAKINDSDEDVCAEAFKAAASLGDAIVARGLARFVSDVVDALKSDVYGPGEQEQAMGLAALAGEAVKHLGDMHQADAVPAVCAAVAYFPKTRYRTFFLTTPTGTRAEENDVVAALGKLGDPRGIGPLMGLIDDKEVWGWGNRGQPNGKVLTQTIGDSALLGILRILKRDPQEFGFVKNTEGGVAAGFHDDATRDESRRRIREWYRDHAPEFATSQPSASSKPGQ